MRVLGPDCSLEGNQSMKTRECMSTVKTSDNKVLMSRTVVPSKTLRRFTMDLTCQCLKNKKVIDIIKSHE